MGLQFLPLGPDQGKRLLFRPALPLKRFFEFLALIVEFFRGSQISEIVSVLDSPYQGDQKVGLTHPRISSSFAGEGPKDRKKALLAHFGGVSGPSEKKFLGIRT